MPPKRFDEATEREIAGRYRAGEDVNQLCAVFDCSKATVRKALAKHQVQLRGREYKRNFEGTPEQIAEATRLYAAHVGVRSIAQRFRCTDTLIADALRSAGVRVRKNGGKLEEVPHEDLAEVAAAHEAGESVSSISNRLGVSRKFVKSMLGHAGTKVRLLDRAWTDEKRSEIVRRFKAGETQAAIAAAVGTNQAHIIHFLRSAGLNRPKKHRYRHASGYVSVVVTEEDKPYCNPQTRGRVLEHRLVMGRYLGRPLRPDETVHHINGQTDDNRIENLQLRTGRHGRGISQVCHDCGSHNIGAVPIAEVGEAA